MGKDEILTPSTILKSQQLKGFVHISAQQSVAVKMHIHSIMS